MMSWMAERDRLLAQTKAFVKEVAAQHPKAASIPAETLVPGPPRNDAGIALVSTPPRISKSPSPPAILPVAEPPKSEVIAAPARVADAAPGIAGPVRKVYAGEADHGGVTARPTALPQSADVVMTIPRMATSERDDIAIRVSQFREHQNRLSREREQFSEQMRARIRSIIGNGG